jgi:hydrogenase nickel incorporation protein HypA/HybF
VNFLVAGVIEASRNEVQPIMHEKSLMRGLLQQIEVLARQNGAGRVRVVRLKVGPLAHMEPDHLREHFAEAARGTAAESARLDIETTEELYELTLEGLDIEGGQP